MIFSSFGNFRCSTEKSCNIVTFVEQSGIESRRKTMEDKILKAIQHIRLKCKKRVTSQNIFSFLNKGASLADTKLFHELLNKMETDGYIFKKGKGKNASFFVKSHLIDNNNNVVPILFELTITLLH